MVNRIIEELKKIDAIEAVALGGSRGRGTGDKDSDYDLYVYLRESLSPEKRREILEKCCSYMEIGNTFWEEEDDCITRDGVVVELIYRSIEDIEGNLKRVVEGKKPSMGYTTCLWDSVVNSKVLYDRRGRLEEMNVRYRLEYPRELRENIVCENHKLIKDYMPSLYYQIEKAVKRGDLVSINHRLTEFLALYFDIIYAVNGELHRGEKRMVETTRDFDLLPESYEELLDGLFGSIYRDDRAFMATLDEICRNLYNLLKKEGYTVTYESYSNHFIKVGEG